MELIVENGKTFLKGIITEANDCLNRPRNRNGRIYPEAILKPAVESLIKRIQEGEEVYAYRNHPDHGDLIRKDSAGMFVELSWDDTTKRAIGKLEVFSDTENGKKILEDLNKGITYGISTRATGALSEDKVVQEGLNIITADFIPIHGISIQSCQSCTLDLHESIQEYYNDFLLEVEDKPCECIYESLSKTEKKILHKYTINKIIEGLK